MKHPLALATHPGLLRRDGQDGSTELEALPATCRQTNSRTALREEGAQGLIFASPIALCARHPMSSGTSKQRLVRELPKNADIPKSPSPFSSSPGAVGRRNNHCK